MNFCFNYSTPIINKNIGINYSIKKYNTTDIKSINFINNHSIKSNELRFTNKLQRNNSLRIKSITNFINDVNNNPNILDYYFEGREISLLTKRDQYKLERLDKILKLNSNVPENGMIIKYTPNKRYYDEYVDGNYERGFQLFYTRDTEGNVIVYLIDLYHLAIPSRNDKVKYIDVMEYEKDIYDCIFKKILKLYA